jgi:hypothetical protein
MHVRGQAALGFDGGEVLHLIAEDAAQVLGEPVEQRRDPGACEEDGEEPGSAMAGSSGGEGDTAQRHTGGLSP